MRTLRVPITQAARRLMLASEKSREPDVSMTFGEPFQLPERNQDGSPMDHQQSADYLMTKIAALLPLEYQGEYTSAPMPKEAQA